MRSGGHTPRNRNQAEIPRPQLGVVARSQAGAENFIQGAHGRVRTFTAQRRIHTPVRKYAGQTYDARADADGSAISASCNLGVSATLIIQSYAFHLYWRNSSGAMLSRKSGGIFNTKAPFFT